MPTSASSNRRAVSLGSLSRGESQQDPESQPAPLRTAAARLGWTVAKEVTLKLSTWDDTTVVKVRGQALDPIEAGGADTLVIWAWPRLRR